VDRGEDVTAQLAAVQTDAADLMADLRELAHGIHPPVLSDRGLVEAIETRADRMPVPVATKADPELRDRRFAADVEAAAYYVVCEALTNVVKHAGARTAAVELSASDGRLTVLVRDDGSGGVAAARATGSPTCATGSRRSAGGCAWRAVRGRAAPSRPSCRWVVMVVAERLRVVIAEDNYLVREGTRRLLEDSGAIEVLAAVGDGDGLCEAVRRPRPRRSAHRHPDAP
jgi:hypothetical protein